ncbi:hypothetical protein L5515_011075 [Caenorhabditis briggsae]|uniref:Homeobox domain-containing protein n=1 Tax=Caenorhabditis briggsae TaxID=6238 RepID=A0AAE9JFY1_CAEBR|nr:hypothetical protein L5515_011075 [Caenorhabditis briggsae]
MNKKNPTEEFSWRKETNKNEIIKRFYAAGNYYSGKYIEELKELTGKNARAISTYLGLLRDRDRKEGKIIPAPPKDRRFHSDKITKFLERAFAKSSDLTEKVYEVLMKNTGLSRRQIVAWYSYHRRRNSGIIQNLEKERRKKQREERQKKNIKPKAIKLFLENLENFKTDRESTMKILMKKTGLMRSVISRWFYNQSIPISSPLKQQFTVTLKPLGKRTADVPTIEYSLEEGAPPLKKARIDNTDFEPNPKFQFNQEKKSVPERRSTRRTTRTKKFADEISNELVIPKNQLARKPKRKTDIKPIDKVCDRKKDEIPEKEIGDFGDENMKPLQEESDEFDVKKEIKLEEEDYDYDIAEGAQNLSGLASYYY